MSDEEEDYDDNIIQCKITLIGESSVGKTSFIKQYISETFFSEIKSTIGGEREYKVIEIDGKKMRLCFWDTAGQEKFRSLSRIFINKSKIVIFVYDITNKESFEQIKDYWYPTTVEILGTENVIYGIAANKCDLYENEKVKYEEAESFANEINAVIKETTATNHKQIDELVTELIKLFLNKKIERPHANSVLKKDNQKGNNKKKCC